MSTCSSWLSFQLAVSFMIFLKHYTDCRPISGFELVLLSILPVCLLVSLDLFPSDNVSWLCSLILPWSLLLHRELFSGTLLSRSSTTDSAFNNFCSNFCTEPSVSYFFHLFLQFHRYFNLFHSIDSKTVSVSFCGAIRWWSHITSTNPWTDLKCSYWSSWHLWYAILGSMWTPYWPLYTWTISSQDPLCVDFRVHCQVDFAGQDRIHENHFALSMSFQPQ